jgi:hypothetical protein
MKSTRLPPAGLATILAASWEAARPTKDTLKSGSTKRDSECSQGFRCGEQGTLSES